MAILDQILRRRVFRGVRYLPFTEPPYTGRYPMPAPRGISSTTNALILGLNPTNKLNALRARPASTNYLYEDRRLWHPLGENAFPKSKIQTYPVILDRLGPLHTPQGEPLKLVPSKKHPSGWTYLPDRPGVLEKARLSNYGFEHPWQTIICLKRKMRREVMNALGYAGKTGFKQPKYTQFSYVRCF